MEPRQLFGREPIYSDVKEVTRDNIFSVLAAAFPIHEKNRADIEYLWNYYKGKQPVLERVREVRPEILNKIVVNRANQIVEFKSGYLIGKPIQFVALTDADDVSDEINTLNEYMYEREKHEIDKEIVDWMHICGTAYRIVLPENTDDDEEAPFILDSLDPRGTFVVYSKGIGHRPLLGVTYVVHDDESITVSAYTKTRYFEIEYHCANDIGLPQDPTLSPLKVDRPHLCGDIPIIEYPLNKARLGAFEAVITIMDALNESESARLDGIDQIIEALLVIEGVDIEDGGFEKLKSTRGLCIPQGTKAYYLCQELNQSQTQITIDDMYQEILEICGMPNRNGGSSTSDNGVAVIVRDGWSDAEARAQSTQDIFQKSEKRFLAIVCRILDWKRGIKLRVRNIEPHFTRQNYENLQSKSQVLTTMLANDKIHPRLAFESCGMFIDAEQAYTESMEYYNETMKKQSESLKAFADAETEAAQREAEEAAAEEEEAMEGNGENG